MVAIFCMNLGTGSCQKKLSFVSVVPILNNKTLLVNSDISCLSVIFCEISYIGHNLRGLLYIPLS